MRFRPVADPERALARQADYGALPGHESSIDSELLDAGVHPDAIPAVKRIMRNEAATMAAEFVRRLVRSLTGTPGAVALQRALLGTDGRSLSEDAAMVGVSKQALAKSEARVKTRLTTVPEV